MIKEGTCWTGLGGKIFLVLKKVELDGHTWIYYRDYRHNIEDDVREYSCYEETFLERFRELPESTKER